MSNALFSPDVEEKCRDILTRHLENSIYEEGAIWYNEYGRIDRDDELSKKLVRFGSADDFRIVTMITEAALFFKILPAKRKIPFVGTTNWDGYFLDVVAKPESTEKLNQLCVHNATEMVNGWGMDEDENRVWLAPRLEMYLA
jgi:hypothetical protein